MLRFELVDYLPLVYKCMAAPPLSSVVTIDGEQKTVNTVIPNFTCKDIWRFSGNGNHPTGVFFEGGAPLRRAYFNAVDNYKAWLQGVKDGTIDGNVVPEPMSADQPDNYKAGRTGLNNMQKYGIRLAEDRLVAGQISCYKVPGYEADDLIWTAYSQLRKKYPDAQIDIFTGDMDMLPMCDEKTSIYMRGNRTWAEPMCSSEYCTGTCDTCAKYKDDSCKIRREFKNYFQVTPTTWDEFISYRSAFKGFNIPYNSVYLFKMLRGDTSDNVPMVEKGWGAKKWNAVIDKMIADGIRFDLLFRYDTPWSAVQPVLLNYFSPEVVALMSFNAEGIRPRSNMGELINLMPYPRDDTVIDIPAVAAQIQNGQQFTPTSYGAYVKAQHVYSALCNGINVGTQLTLKDPIKPDLGIFQTSLNALKINLSTANMPY